MPIGFLPFPGTPGPWPGHPLHQGQDLTPVVQGITPNSGALAGGTAVTITGLNFRNNNDGTSPAVTIGGVAATAVVVVSSTSITCTTGAGTLAALVNVSVTVAGLTGTLFGGFCYFAASILSVTPAFGPAAGGTAVTIKGFNFIAGSTVAFGGVAATGVAVIDSNTISCTTPAGTNFVDVTVTDPSNDVATLRVGFQYTTLSRANNQDVRRRSPVPIHIREVLGNTPNQAIYAIDGQSNRPQVGEKITLVDTKNGNKLIFAGNIQSVDQEYEGKTTNLVWQVTALDFTFLLNFRRPFGAYVNTPAGDIVKDLIARFAPGFTVTHVQSGLTPITCVFDGSQDFGTVLNAIAQGIGGGHWYVDYNQDVHFFHLVPKVIKLQTTNPQQPMTAGAAAMTVAEGALNNLSYSFSPGYYMFASTFVFDNGVESQLSLWSNVLPLRGDRSISISGVPTGPTIGGHATTKRRIYYFFFPVFGGRAGIFGAMEVEDNTTVAFTAGDPFGHAPSTAAVVPFPANTSLPAHIYTPPPAGPTAAPTIVQNASTLFAPPSPPFNDPVDLQSSLSYTGGLYLFKVCFLYADGTTSLPSPESGLVQLDGTHGATCLNLPIGPAVSGIPAIARIVFYEFMGNTVFPFGSFADDWAQSHSAPWAIVPDNTTVTADLAGPGIGYSMPVPPVNPLNQNGIAGYPNIDGPNLEVYPAPEDLSASSQFLLQGGGGGGIQVTSITDLAQTRNRVFVRGAGSATTTAAAAGATTLVVADLSLYDPTGGQLIVGVAPSALTPIKGQVTLQSAGVVLNFLGVSGTTGAGTIFLSSPLSAAIPQGAPIDNWMEVNNVASQLALAAVEKDVNGNPTDGVHEYTVVDRSLVLQAQLYNRAYAELELFSDPIVTIKYATKDPNTRVGQTVHVDLTNPPLQGDFLIQDISIDQFHDESDLTGPRYSVTASSVKYNLTDLLLLIAQQASLGVGSGGGGNFTGIASTSVVTLPPNTILPQRKMHWTELDNAFFNQTTTPTLVNVNASTAVAGTGLATSGVTDTLGYWYRMTAAAAPTTEARINFPNKSNGMFTLYHNPIVKIRFRTGPTIGGTNYRFFVYVTADTLPSGPNNADTNTAGIKGFGIMFRFGVDSAWTVFTADGSAAYATGGSVAPFTASTVYDIVLQCSTVSATFTVNTNPPVSMAIPSAILNLGLGYDVGMRLFGNQVATQSFDWNAIYVEHD